MALIKTSLWVVPVALLPVVCGTPCEVGGRSSGGFGGARFETGVFIETGFTTQQVFISTFLPTCNAADQVWSFTAQIGGQEGPVMLYPRYATDEIQMLDEGHEMLLFENEGGMRTYALDLPIVEPGEWVFGESTAIPCGETQAPEIVFVLDALGLDGAPGHCLIVGEQAAAYMDEFPDCALSD